MLRLSLLAVLAALVGACGDASSPLPPSPVTGVIVEIHGEGSDIRSFTLASGDETYEIRIADDVDYGFDLAHLREHQAAGEAVRCRVEDRGGAAYALTIEDVPQ